MIHSNFYNKPGRGEPYQAELGTFVRSLLVFQFVVFYIQTYPQNYKIVFAFDCVVIIWYPSAVEIFCDGYGT